MEIQSGRSLKGESMKLISPTEWRTDLADGVEKPSRVHGARCHPTGPIGCSAAANRTDPRGVSIPHE